MHCVVNYSSYLSLIGAIKSTLRNYIIEHVLKKKKYNQFSEVNDQEKSRGTQRYRNILLTSVQSQELYKLCS